MVLRCADLVHLHPTGAPAGTAHAARAKTLAPLLAYYGFYWCYAVLNLFERHPAGAPAGTAHAARTKVLAPFGAYSGVY